MKLLFAALFSLLAAPLVFAADAPPAAVPKVALQPLGKIAADVLAETRKSLERLYAVEVVTLPVKDLPASAFYRPRERYRAEKLLDWLHANTDAAYAKVIGVTQSDISTTKGDNVDWGIFGLGAL